MGRSRNFRHGGWCHDNIFSHQRFSQRVSKPIATCDFPGGDLDPLDPRMDINEFTLYLIQEQGSEGIICCFQELSSSSQHENTKPIDIGFLVSICVFQL